MTGTITGTTITITGTKMTGIAGVAGTGIIIITTTTTGSIRIGIS
jgi:hypothetical protein